MKEKIKKDLEEAIKIKNELIDSSLDIIADIADKMIKSIKNGNKLIIFGNGGSAADSQHMAAELVGRFKKERKPIPAIALTTNTSTITSVANDYGYNQVFLRQLEALAKEGDVVLAISTSGNSQNVIEAVNKAKEMGLLTVGFTGRDGGKLAKFCDISLCVPSDDTARIQEAHISCIHILCELIENSVI